MYFHDSLLFLKKFFTQFQVNASIRPTSPTAANLLVNSIDRTNVRTILELGPGTGPITKYILEAMSVDSSYMGIEYDQEYVDILKKRFLDTRAKFIQADVKDLSSLVESSGWDHIDLIVSSLPYKPFMENSFLFQYLDKYLEKGTQLRCISYSPSYFQKVYRSLGLHILGFTRRNFPPMYVMGNHVQKK